MVAQYLEEEVNAVVLPKEVAVEAHSKEPVRANNDRVKVNSTIREVAVVVVVDDLDGEIMTSHSETEILRSLFVLVGR